MCACACGMWCCLSWYVECYFDLSTLLLFRDLYFGNCTVTAVAPTIEQLTNLTNVDISGNALSTIPSNCLAKLTELKRLNLSHNNLTELNDGM